MMSKPHPYSSQPPKAFWRKAIAQRHFLDIDTVWTPMPLHRRHRIATAGSCFAQHIGRAFLERGAAFMDLEPAPPLFADGAQARRWGYGLFSCRYGNIYTPRQLLQLFDEAHGERTPVERVWESDGRFFDAMRPGVDPVGQDSAASVLALRTLHLAHVREMFATLDVFVFTMGLTEGWESVSDGTMFPVAPGAIAGAYNKDWHRLRNLRHFEVLSDMVDFRKRLRRVNPGARILLTISPVPLTATATGEHVLAATTYSKSVLRSVAGELAEDFEDVFYFPSYEIISAAAGRGMFFEPDMRNVNRAGVQFVMQHFFSGPLATEFPLRGSGAAEELDLICDESHLDRGDAA